MVSHKFLVFTYGCSNHPYIKKGGYSSIGRTTVCGTVSSLFESGYPPSILFGPPLLFFTYIMIYVKKSKGDLLYIGLLFNRLY